MHNPVLNANAAVDEAHHRVSAAGFKYYVTEMVCWATGGPQNYTGRSMSEAHKNLKITESEWDAFCKDFVLTIGSPLLCSGCATVHHSITPCESGQLPTIGFLGASTPSAMFSHVVLRRPASCFGRPIRSRLPRRQLRPLPLCSRGPSCEPIRRRFPYQAHRRGSNAHFWVSPRNRKS
jgi:hypothetical protein